MRLSTFLKKWNPLKYRMYVREKEFAKKNLSPLDPWTVQAELCWVGHRIQPPVAGRSFLVNKVDRQQSRPSWLPLAIASGSLVRVSSQVLLWTHPNSWRRTTSSQRCCSLGTWYSVALPSLASAAAASAVEVLSFFSRTCSSTASCDLSWNALFASFIYVSTVVVWEGDWSGVVTCIDGWGHAHCLSHTYLLKSSYTDVRHHICGLITDCLSSKNSVNGTKK